MTQSTENKLINLLLHKQFKKFFLGAIAILAPRRALLAVLVIGAVALLQSYFPTADTNSSTPVQANVVQASLLTDGEFQVKRVVDGDTFVYVNATGEDKTVRLLGVDTPETKDPRKPVQCFGKEASDETKSLIDGKIVKIASDPKADNLDRYQRELRYVYLPDGRMLNRILVTEGFAHATPEYPFSFKEEFVNLEKEANIAGKGLWNKSVCN